MIRTRALPLLALAFVLARPQGVLAAEPGARGAEEGSAAPTKKVEEPVFQLPELVIIGENQARIMAQKERLAGTPLKGLREAPLLEKEESAVAGIRERLSVGPGGEIREGTYGLARLEGGFPAWGGGAFWVGRQTARAHTSFGLFGSQLQGEDAAGEVAGGRELGISAGTGFISGAGDFDAGNARLAALLALLGSPDSGSANLGWRRVSRDLPYLAAGRQRHFDRFSLAGEAAHSVSGFSGEADLSFARLRVPRESLTAGMAGASARVRLWQAHHLAVSMEPGLRAEAAETAGNHTQLGARLKAAWVPGERWRLDAGVNAEGIYGDGVSAGLFSPVAGVSWTSPWGPTLAGSFGAGLRTPWMTGQAAAVPYSCFTSGLVPERTRTDISVRAWQEHWSGSYVEVGYRGRDIRQALSWQLRSGEGLFEPAAVSRLRLNELVFALKFRNATPLRFQGRAIWRGIGSRGGEAANLPNGEGTLGAGYDFGRFSLDAELSVVGERPGSFAGAGEELAAYENLNLRLTWLPEKWLRVYVGGENVLGRPIQLWQGYPEPKHLVSAGVLAAF